MNAAIKRFDLTFPEEGKQTMLVIMNEAGAPVATVGLKWDGQRVAEFFRLFVREDERRKGHARKLLTECIAIAKAAGCESLSCYVKPRNHVAQWFYQRLGFNVVFIFGDGDLCMSRALQ